MKQSASHSTLQVPAINRTKVRPKSAHYDGSESFMSGSGLPKPSPGGAAPYSLETEAPSKSQASPALRRDISRSNPGLVTPSIHVATVGNDKSSAIPDQVFSPAKEHEVTQTETNKTKSWMCSAPSLNTTYQ